MRHVDVSQVQELLPDRKITEDEMAYVESLIDEAGDLVEAYCRRVFDPAPDAVQRVICRMVVRAIKQGEQDGDVLAGEVSNVSYTAGPFSRSYAFTGGSTLTGVWLSRTDKQRLAMWHGRKAFTVMPKW